MSDVENPPVVYKVIGAPGTGKTTRVVGNPELPDVTSLVMENLEEYPFEDQMIVTYTNAGVDEAAERLEKILDTPRYRINNRVVTIHAQCFRTLGVDRDQVVRWWHKQRFCNEYDLKYGRDSDDGDIMSADHDEGHALFQIYEWCKNNMVALEDWEECPAEYPGTDDPRYLMEEWEKYKAKGGQDNDTAELIQFCDMIERTVLQGQKMLHDEGFPNIFSSGPDDPMETFKQTRHIDRFDQEKWRGRGPFIDTRVLYVDEVQDLYPLQWAWYLMQKLVCEKVYIGGDDDQTIYGWAGANPDFMLDEEGDFEVLDRTYRIPADIWGVCDNVISQVDKRQDKDVTPHGDGGEVYKMIAPPHSQIMQHIVEGECMILFRANYMIDEFRNSLHEFGIPYRNMSTYDTWSDDLVTLRDGLAKIEDGEEKISSEEVDVMVDHANRECTSCNGNGCKSCGYSGEESLLADDNGYGATESSLNKLGGISAERVDEIFDLTHPYRSEHLTANNFISQTSELNYYEKQAILGNFNQRYTDLYPDRVRIGTIHSAKGKEAETVILALDSTQRIIENMLEDTRDRPGKNINDAERRVYYVGMTRASEKLILAQGIIDAANSINLTDLLEEYERDKEEWAVSDATMDSTW